MKLLRMLPASLTGLVLLSGVLALAADNPTAAKRRPRIAVLDFDYGTVQTATGGAVTQWSDDSGNGNHLLQSVVNARPTLVASVQNGKPAVQFGGDDFLKAAGQVSLSGRPSATWLAIVRAIELLGPASRFSHAGGLSLFRI